MRWLVLVFAVSACGDGKGDARRPSTDLCVRAIARTMLIEDLITTMGIGPGDPMVEETFAADPPLSAAEAADRIELHDFADPSGSGEGRDRVRRCRREWSASQARCVLDASSYRIARRCVPAARRN